MAVIGSPTDFQRSNTSDFQAEILADKTLDIKTKSFLIAALMCVGQQSHGKSYMPDFNNWEVGSANVHSGAEKGLNCWTAVIYWAYQGGAISKATLTQYLTELRSKSNDDPGTQMQAENVAMYSFMRANQAVKIAKADKPPPGVTIFFGDSTWKRPLNHVVASLGGGYCVSQQSLFIGVKMSAVDEVIKLNPTINTDDLLRKGLTHISSIKIIAESNEEQPEIRVTPKPFWELPRIPWT